MKRLIIIIFVFLVYTTGTSQQKELSNYQFVLVPDSFEFLKEPDQYQLNSMTVFYLEKSGFNAFLVSKAPELDGCSGLYANVENLGSLLGGRLQVVLSDCNNNEVYRSEIGRSKVKDYEKTYQDALRRAFRSIEVLGVRQREIPAKKSAIVNTRIDNSNTIFENGETENASGNLLPSSKFTSYSHEGNSYLLRKTEEGYSFYEENANSENGLSLLGKIIVMESVVKFMDNSGKVSDVEFDAAGNLTLKDAIGPTYFQLVD